MTEEKSEGVAAVLSLVIPGAGQMYCGQVGRGIGFLVGFFIGLFFFFIPGFIIWIVGIVDAVSCAKQYNAQRTMKCPRCMNTIPRGALVCTMCGAPIAGMAYPMVAAPMMMPAPQPAYGAQPGYGQPAYGQPAYAQPQPMMAQPAAQPAATQNCPGCCKPITWYAQHSRWWCAAENKWL